MRHDPAVSCLVLLLAIAIAMAWICLLFSSLFFPPKVRQKIILPAVRRAPLPEIFDGTLQPPTALPPPSRPPMRTRESMLIITSAVLFMALVALYLALARAAS